MSLYQRLLGLPTVYNRIRPLVVGGLDMSPSYRNLACTAEDVVVDIGCGTGDALNYLGSFKELHGFDNDSVAIDFARKTAAEKGRQNVFYECSVLTAADLERIRPTRIMMSGLLHHLSDEEAISLLQMCAACPSVRRIATQDVVFLKGELVSNVLAWLDRGKFVRTVDGFRELVARAGLRVSRDELMRSHPTNGRAIYLLMVIEPGQS